MSSRKRVERDGERLMALINESQINFQHYTMKLCCLVTLSLSLKKTNYSMVALESKNFLKKNYDTI